MTRGVLATACGLLLLAAVIFSVLQRHELVAWVGDVVAQLRAFGPWGWLGFFALQFIVTLIGVLPASALAIAAGAVYGVTAGFPACALGVLAGALTAFGLSRSAFRQVISRTLNRSRRLTRLDGMVGQQGWKLVCLLRISPLMPFSLTSYALGLSSISLADYMLGTLASLPALFLYVWLGELGASASASTSLRLGLLIAGVLTTLLLTVRLGQIANRALNQTPSALPDPVLPPT